MGLVLARFHAPRRRSGAGVARAPTRALIPGPVAFYATLAVLLVPIAVADVVCSSDIAARAAGHAEPARAGRRRATFARFASARRSPGRLTLGRVDGRLVAAEPRESVIVIGPTQTGKTTGFAIPAILEWQGPVRRDVGQDRPPSTTPTPRAARSRTRDSGSTTRPAAPATRTAGWTPLAGLRDLAGRPARRRPGSSRRPRHERRDRGRRASGTAPPRSSSRRILLAAAARRRHDGDVVQWLDTQERTSQCGLALERTRGGRFERIRREPRSGTNGRAVNVYATAETVLIGLRRPGRSRVCQSADFDAERLLDGGHHTAYLCAPAHEQRRLQPLFATLVQEIVARAYERADRDAASRSIRHCSSSSTSAPTSPRFATSPTLASTGAGQGIQLVSVFQDMAQINAVYGRDHAPTIVSNHRAKVVLSGIADPRDARLRRRAARRRGGAPGCLDPRRRRADARPPSPSPTGRSRPRTSCAR